ncbi:tRNA (guanine-N(7)-)-methyltransferase non-catalytic subunit wdr4 isoform X2 [Melanotaenia boesemani]|uniref:tRNA (guanine-N(7)-)-methyltransferase non-catalytic subunit wdr4 isoform X2 n=1 Tax=Melanotaenia boesemani TaxID=1250792 RepID=UPI001C059DD8|nr:tRNA (guanine-N(7)-)-methyltransferase non-catalytic subunit wdr4 isoform X2 [Melanotaenia boesemani]
MTPAGTPSQLRRTFCTFPGGVAWPDHPLTWFKRDTNISLRVGSRLPAMTAVGFCGHWFLFTCDTKLVAVHTKQSRDPFVFDCSRAEKKPNLSQADSSRDGGPAEETGSDRVLTFTVSSSGRLVALTDDSKRLVLLACEPSWRCISIRCVVRRCTSLAFSQAEDELLVADKSGDVYSFSVEDPEREAELKMGHLSMLLAVAVSPGDRYVITADRDEKIRVSHRRSPYNIQSFCLGHEQFVSALQIPSGHPHWLLSGSGDGTVKLWEYESGRRLQSWDLRQLAETPGCETDKDQNPAVCRVSVSPDGLHVAVQCERVRMVQFFILDEGSEKKLVPRSRQPLSHCPLDMTFDPDGRLWVLLDHSDALIQIHRLTQDSWENHTKDPELSRVQEVLQTHWKASARTSSRFEQLYKTSYDNVTTYLQKKQQRLEEQQKRTKAQEENANKRLKKEASGGGT